MVEYSTTGSMKLGLTSKLILQCIIHKRKLIITGKLMYKYYLLPFLNLVSPCSRIGLLFLFFFFIEVYWA